MRVIEKIAEMQSWSDRMRVQGKRIGLVPTMGYLHEGHLSLIDEAKQVSDVVVVSIFVNPIQFGPSEDYQGYPRDLDRDIRLVEEKGGDIVFHPSVDEMYPEGSATYVDVEGITETLCGASRPGHFRGVTTVVTKLFNIVKPHVAVFGQKDAQQTIVIKRMATDLSFDVDIVVAPTIREPDGVAMSSRNIYLTPSQRLQATSLYRALRRAEEMVDTGERETERLIGEMKKIISSQPEADIDYVSIVDVRDLKPIVEISGRVLIALAVKFGKARLIDNIILDVG